jgi:2-dehydro-3-deoxy-D-gluconate 5-dehydrogenase
VDLDRQPGLEGFSLHDRVALVTGGGRGIGAAMARALAGAGALTVLTSRGEDQLRAVAGEISTAGGRADVLPADLSGEQAPGLVDEVIRRHGRLDVVVHAAGNQVRKPPLEVTLADWDAVLDVHLRAAFSLAQAAGRHMADRGSGSIIFVGSMTSTRFGSPSTLPYAAAKSGLLGLARSLAVGLGPRGVRVNTVLPGFIGTEMTREADRRPERIAIMSRAPGGAPGTPGDLGGVAVFLASDAARYVTGETIAVDGGWGVA